jgi:hypothetical protein
LPQPVGPQTSVGRPFGSPPPVISSSPWMPVGDLGSCFLVFSIFYCSFCHGILWQALKIDRQLCVAKLNIPKLLSRWFDHAGCFYVPVSQVPGMRDEIDPSFNRTTKLHFPHPSVGEALPPPLGGGLQLIW